MAEGRSETFSGASGSVNYSSAPTPIQGPKPPEGSIRLAPASKQNYGLNRLTAWEAPQGASRGGMNQGSFLDLSKVNPEG